MFQPGVSDAGSGSGRRAQLLGDPGGPLERPRDKEGAKGRGGGGGGEFGDLPAGTSAPSGPSESGNQSPAGETDYCRRILVRGKGRLRFRGSQPSSFGGRGALVDPTPAAPPPPSPSPSPAFCLSQLGRSLRPQGALALPSTRPPLALPLPLSFPLSHPSSKRVSSWLRSLYSEAKTHFFDRRLVLPPGSRFAAACANRSGPGCSPRGSLFSRLRPPVPPPRPIPGIGGRAASPGGISAGAFLGWGGGVERRGRLELKCRFSPVRVCLFIFAWCVCECN